jgi:hypothetical protein
VRREAYARETEHEVSGGKSSGCFDILYLSLIQVYT